jgi:hypothetical protein
MLMRLGETSALTMRPGQGVHTYKYRPTYGRIHIVETNAGMHVQSTHTYARKEALVPEEIYEPNV